MKILKSVKISESYSESYIQRKHRIFRNVHVETTYRNLWFKLLITLFVQNCRKYRGHAQIRSHGYTPFYVRTWSCDCAGQMIVILPKQVSLAYMVKV